MNGRRGLQFLALLALLTWSTPAWATGVLTAAASVAGSGGSGDVLSGGTTDITGLVLGNGATLAAYGGTSCTNQVLRLLSVSGAGTCITITSAYVDSTIQLALANLTNALSIFDGSAATAVTTYRVTGTDPTITASSGALDVTGALSVGGVAVLTAVPAAVLNATMLTTTDQTATFPNSVNVGTPLAATDDSVAVGNGTVYEVKAMPTGPLGYTASSNAFAVTGVWDLDLVGVTGGTATHIWNDDPLSTACTPLTVAGTNRTTGVCTFPDGDGDYGRQISKYLAGTFSGTLTLDAVVIWKTTGTGNARFQFQTKCYASDEADDASFNTASVVTAAAGTSARPNMQAITGITVTGCAAGELLRIRFYRNRTEGSDTLNAALDVEKVIFTYKGAP